VIGVGDVIAVRTGGIGGWFIRLGARLRGLPHSVNHVLIVHHLDEQGRWVGLEGRPGGVGWVDCTDYIKSPATVDNREQPKTEAQRYLVAKAAESLIGCAYDWSAVLVDAGYDLGLPRPDDLDWHGAQKPLHIMCSAYAAWSYTQVALARPTAPERFVEPPEWAAWDAAKGWAK
jgi:hypothetical protein